MWRFIFQAILHLPISLICKYSEHVLFEVPNFQSKIQILNFFCSWFLFIEDSLFLGLYRIFSKTKNQLVPRLGQLFFFFFWGSFRFNSSNLDKTHWFHIQGEANSKIKCWWKIVLRQVVRVFDFVNIH